jgi:hypothetical protein
MNIAKSKKDIIIPEIRNDVMLDLRSSLALCIIEVTSKYKMKIPFTMILDRNRVIREIIYGMI